MTERLNWTELNVLKQESKVLILLCFFLLPSFLSPPFLLFAFFFFFSTANCYKTNGLYYINLLTTSIILIMNYIFFNLTGSHNIWKATEGRCYFLSQGK